MDFWHQQSEGVEVEAEAIALEVAIAEEKKRLSLLDKRLHEFGFDVEEIENLEESSCDNERIGVEASV